MVQELVLHILVYAAGKRGGTSGKDLFITATDSIYLVRVHTDKF